MGEIKNEAEIIPLLSLTSTTSENRSGTAPFVANLAVGTETSISPVTPTVTTKIDESDNDIPSFSIRQIYKNLIILSFAFLLFATAASSILSLQSSLNTKANVGVNSLIISNVFLLFSSIFLTGIIIDIFGLKWTIMIGVFAYVLYVIANIRPTPTFMYITGAFTGITATPLWTSQGTYINTIARSYAHHTQKKVADIVSLFFGIFFAIFATAGIWGNLISYLIINQSNHTHNSNCGAHFDPLSKSDTDESVHVSDFMRYVLCGAFAGMSILSMILLFFFVDQIRLTKTQPVVQSLKKSLDLIQSLFRWKNIDQLFLLPMIMWSMVESTFLTTQFTRAFVTCLVGIRFIGLVLICKGVCNAMCSYIFGSLVKYIGRLGCFIIAAALSYTAIIFMYLWDPLEDQMYILFIISGVWGIADAIWEPQVLATYTVLYAETDSSALAKFHLWKGVGSLVTLSYASYITIELTLIILFSFLTVSMICYFIVEIHFRWKNNAKKS